MGLRMWARLGLAVGYMVTGCGAVSPTVLIWNDAGKPTEIGMNATELCHGRSHQHKDCSILLDVPKSCASEKSTCPVAFFLHGEGATDSGKEFARGDRAVSSALHSINWIGVYPTGDGEWNGDVATGNNDVEFMVTIVDFIASLGAFDAWQPKMGEPPDGTPGLYFYGVGTGAALVQKLAANADAILPIKGIWADGAQLLQSPLQSGPGSMNFNRPGESHKSAAVAQMASHGTNDAVFPYQGGGPKTQHNCTICKLMSELESNKAWAIHNKCNITAPPSTTTVNATYLGSTKSAMLTKTTATMHTFQGCPADKPVRFWSIKNAPNDATITIQTKALPSLVIEFFQEIQFAQPAHLPGAKPDIWEDPGIRDPMIAGIVVLVCFCCVFCLFCRSGSLKSRSAPDDSRLKCGYTGTVGMYVSI